ncbi:hypothetical protein [Achromobacter spanius]|uniref:Uncharacterized protein n=1 Tax=Achromobacter spanius TaxID=217203 RepID=A0AAW3HYP6_9BURK|nr:hypothetical protein [Achromobacter spanius]KNE23857.1 hypothetical protein AFM18_26415 [Achromobacter spanius]
MQEIHQIAITSLPDSSMAEILVAGWKMSLDMLTALGTIGAVAAAIWIATRDARERRERRRVDAIISAWLVAPEVAELKEGVNMLRRSLNAILSGQVPGLPMPEGMQTFLRYLVGRLDMPLTSSRVQHLPDFGTKTGPALAALLGQLPAIKTSIRGLIELDGALQSGDLTVCRQLLKGCDLLDGYLADVQLSEDGKYH